MNCAQILTEVEFKAVRSGGPGGQHANKVASKVQLRFDVQASNGLSTNEKTRILQKLGNLISKEGLLSLSVETHRSQHQNKDLVVQRLFTLLKEALQRPKARRATRPSKGSVQKRLDSKKKAAQKKALRRSPNL